MITESKIKSGTLTFTVDSQQLDFSCQPTNVRIRPAHDTEGDPQETLCGDMLGAEETRNDSLLITAIQDFTDAAGFQAFTWEHDREEVAFSWAPRGAAGPSWSGTVKVRAVEIGGDINRRLTVEAEWPLLGLATWNPVVP